METNSVKKAVSKGYKQTEIGVIPEDWEIKKISKLCSITTGNKNTQDKIENGLYPFFIRSQTIEKINSYSFDGEAVLIAGDGDIGKIFHYINGRFDFHQRVYKMSSFKPELDGFYFYKYFSNKFYNRIMSMTAKSTVDSIRREMITDMIVAVPPIKEQIAIAKILSDVDALLTALQNLITKKRAIKIASMQQLLTGKTRLPGFGEGKDMKQTELGEIPEDWEIKPLGSILKIRHGKSQKDIINPIGTYPILATGGEIGKTNIPLYSKPSVLIGRKGTIDVPRYMDTPFWTVDTLFYTEIQTNTDPKFVFYKFEFINWYLYNEASGVPSLNAATIEKIILAFPTFKSEQIAISSIITNFDNEIDAFERYLIKTQHLKQSMMQQLLTGKIRLT